MTDDEVQWEFEIAPADCGAWRLPPGVARAEASATVLKVDRWGRRRAMDIVERWRAADIGEHSASVVADAHEALFSPQPQATEHPADPHRAAWWQQLMETPEYQALHRQTCLSPALSELAAARICASWAEYAAAHGPPAQGGESGGEEPVADTVARIRSTARALADAGESVATARALTAGVGMGDPGSLSPQAVTDCFRRVRDNPALRAIMEMAGRALALCRALQWAKTTHSRDDMVGVERSGEIARLLPSELTQLGSGVPELELLALHRLVSRQALSRKYSGKAPEGRGPLVVSIDESGSMRGEPIALAKGIALTMAWLAHHQRRWIMLAGFAGGAEATRYVAPPADLKALLDNIEHFWGGGTTLEAPLKTVPSWWPELQPPEGRTDHIIITDAVVNVGASQIAAYRAWAAKHQVKTYGIVVGQRDAGSLRGVCDRFWTLEALSLEAGAVQEILSV